MVFSISTWILFPLILFPSSKKKVSYSINDLTTVYSVFLHFPKNDKLPCFSQLSAHSFCVYSHCLLLIFHIVQCRLVIVLLSSIWDNDIMKESPEGDDNLHKSFWIL